MNVQQNDGFEPVMKPVGLLVYLIVFLFLRSKLLFYLFFEGFFLFFNSTT